MALRRRNVKADLLWLKWPLILLGIVSVAAMGLFFSAAYFRDDMQRQELSALGEFDLITGQVREIEQSEQIIINNIGRFNLMAANGLLDEEDRVGLLEEISQIRERYQLFPISVEIGEQDRILLQYPPEIEFPEEQISLRSSQVRIQFPLLHEEDLTRFLDDFLDDRRLMIVNNCSINAALESPELFLSLVQHQIAACDFYWYTFRREPYSGV